MGSSSSSNKQSSNYPTHNDPAYRKCQELKMERWIQMHYQIKERERAMEIAKNRELFFWLGGFYLLSSFGSISHYQRYKRASIFLPLVPLSFVMAYYTDLAYGSKIHRITAEANMIMDHEPELLHWPNGLPTVASIDEARAETEMEHRLHPHHS